MILEFRVDEQDFLTYQLFSISQSRMARKRMLCTWIILILYIGAMGFYFYFLHEILLAIFFWILTVVLGFFYPKILWWIYKRNYKAYNRENYSGRFGFICHLEIGDNSIFLKNKTGETTIAISETETVYETDRYFFVRIKTGVSCIIPKYKIANSDEVRTKFKNLGFYPVLITNNKWKYWNIALYRGCK